MSKEDLLKKEEDQKKNYMLATKDGKVEISPENVARVFAMISNSPQYKKAEDTDNDDSSAYWFAKWKKNKTISEGDLLSLLQKLNKENRTRVSNRDLKRIRKRIDPNKIKDRLQKADYSLIETIIENCTKTLFSFATKFCHYACMYLLEGEARDNFPIFDGIINQNLGTYSSTWINLESAQKLYKEGSYKSIKKEIGLENFYKLYVNAISELATSAGVSKTGVEQLIWYYHNGG